MKGINCYTCGFKEPFTFDQDGYGICAGMTVSKKGEFVKVEDLREWIKENEGEDGRGIMTIPSECLLDALDTSLAPNASEGVKK